LLMDTASAIAAIDAFSRAATVAGAASA